MNYTIEINLDRGKLPIALMVMAQELSAKEGSTKGIFYNLTTGEKIGTWKVIAEDTKDFTAADLKWLGAIEAAFTQS